MTGFWVVVSSFLLLSIGSMVLQRRAERRLAKVEEEKLPRETYTFEEELKTWTWSTIVETIDDPLSGPRLISVRGPMLTEQEAKAIIVRTSDPHGRPLDALRDSEERIWPIGLLRSSLNVYKVETK